MIVPRTTTIPKRWVGGKSERTKVAKPAAMITSEYTIPRHCSSRPATHAYSRESDSMESSVSLSSSGLERSEFAWQSERNDVTGMIVRQSFSVVLTGTAIGLAASVGFAHLMMSLLYGVNATDIPTLAAVSAIVVFEGTLAAYVPARRAARADPLTTLRSE